MIAKPFSPGNAFAADEVARQHLTFDKALIGSCTNGSYDDLLGAALVIRAARETGLKSVPKSVHFIVFPGSGTVRQQIERPDQRLGNESIADVFRVPNPKLIPTSIASAALLAKRPPAPRLVVRKVQEALRRSLPTFRACLEDMKADR